MRYFQIVQGSNALYSVMYYGEIQGHTGSHRVTRNRCTHYVQFKEQPLNGRSFQLSYDMKSSMYTYADPLPAYNGVYVALQLFYGNSGI